MPGTDGLARLSREYGVPSREARGLCARGSYANALIILESKLCFVLLSVPELWVTFSKYFDG